jgi:phosphoglycolate phosphatase-like HAD superfamily hydrolase
VAEHVRGGLPYEPNNWWWRKGKVEPGRAVVFDIDGVLADAAHRQYLVTGARRNWDLFFEMCGKDDLIEPVATTGRLLSADLRVILLTARPSWVAPETIEWCERNDVRWDLLIMREYGDYSMARDFKDFTVSELRQFGFDLELAYEDDKRNVAMFEQRGIPCVYIHSGYH